MAKPLIDLYDWPIYSDRAAFLDLRPYMNMAPISVQEEASVGVSFYELW